MNLFSKKQFGFITSRSTTLQLLEVLDKWTQAVDSGENVDCIYMDFQKAFDKVPIFMDLHFYGWNTHKNVNP
jgi:sarcosine oxidase/L-pipecolate oxidase